MFFVMMICNSSGGINTYNPVVGVLSLELSALREGGVPWAAVLTWAQIKLHSFLLEILISLFDLRRQNSNDTEKL